VTRSRKSRQAAGDPLLRACPACSAGKGQGCHIAFKTNSQLVMKATRLVHADRLDAIEPMGRETR